MLASTQDLKHSAQNFVNLAGDHFGSERPIFFSMETLQHHIDRFERKYDKAFAKYPLFGADLMDCIHKRVQVFLYFYNRTAIEDVESGDLTEFNGIHKKV